MRDATATQPVTTNAATDRNGHPRKFWNSQLVLGIAVLAVVLFFQWPMLKGVFYKAVGAEAASAVAWREDFEAARAEAQTSRKPMLLVFSAAWCPACVMMENDVWSDPAVGQVANERFVPFHVDVDDPQQAAVTRRYAIRAIPTVLIVDQEGRVLQQAAAMSSRTALDFLKAE
ncbi:MAG: thioredoxin family protein [Aureliella sp.]